MKRRDLVAGSLLTATAASWTTAWAQANESTWERVTRTKVIRVGAVDGGLPHYKKDIASGEWVGFMVDLYRSLARSLDAKLDITPTSWGNSVLELQSQKIDIFFGMNPTPARLQVIDFTESILNVAFAVVCRKGYAPKTWAELDQPAIRIVVDKGSSHDTLVTRLLKNANIIRLDTAIDATLALQVGRADAQVLVLPLALSLASKNPAVGQVVILTPEEVASSHGGIRKEADARWLQYLNGWLASERASGNVRRAFIANLKSVGGVSEDKIPPQIKV